MNLRNYFVLKFLNDTFNKFYSLNIYKKNKKTFLFYHNISINYKYI